MEDATRDMKATSSASRRHLPASRGALLAVVIVGGLALTGGLCIWRIRDVSDVPDVGDPFDVADAQRPLVVAEADNAFVLYEAAEAKLSKPPEQLRRVELKQVLWSRMGTEVRSYLEQNRQALELWRSGTNRPDALYCQPGTASFDTSRRPVWDLWPLCTLAILEGSRLETAGKQSDAWPWYLAVLRCSRHCGQHGWIMERARGAYLHEGASHRIVTWAADPRVDAPLLRQALDQTKAADDLTEPLSEMLRYSYLLYRRDLVETFSLIDSYSGRWPPPGGPSWLDRLSLAISPRCYRGYQEFHVKACNDVERSRLVLQLLFANWLPQADRPASARAPVAIHTSTLFYADDPSAPSSARALPPDAFAAALEHTILARYAVRGATPDQEGKSFLHTKMLWEGDGELARESRRRTALILRLAAELYRREHGRDPAQAGELLGRDLASLPEGIKSDDPIPAKLD
jgi:hypothetical protein